MAVSTPLLQQAAVVSDPGENYSISLQNDIPVATPKKNEILIKLTCTGLW
jgi:propanol-preferring alcohol dehydrogenase